MATALNSNRARAQLPKAPPPDMPAAEPAAPMVENEATAAAPTIDLQVAEHLSALTALATPPADSSPERAAALTKRHNGHPIAELLSSHFVSPEPVLAKRSFSART